MTRAFALAILWLGLPSAAFPITFSPQPARTGQVEATTSHFGFGGTLEVKVGGEPLTTVPFSTSRDAATESEVLATAGPAATRLRVRFPTAEDKSTFGDQTKTEKAVVAGKTYLLEKRDGKVTVTREDGLALAGGEAEELSSAVESLEKPELACEGFSGRDWKIGDKADMRDPGVAALLHLSAEDELEHFEVTLQEIRPAGGAVGEKEGKGGPQVAVFGLSLRFRATVFEGAELTLPLTGELRIEAPGCRLVSFDGNGPMEIDIKTEAEGEALEFKGRGEVKLTVRGEYR